MANAGGALNQLSPAEPLERITNARRLRWTALAFVPSSLMLSATTYISTDIASLPLLWVIPLSIYLLTLIVAFARRRMISRRLVALLMPGATIVLVLVYLSGATQPALFLALLHLIYLFIASLSCHFQLADERPEARRLAEYYLWMSIGGALGGLFNALLAPALFDAVVEYPLAILLATLLRPALKPRRAESLAGPLKIATDDAFQFSRQPENEVAGFNRLDLLLPVVMGALTLALGWLAGRYLPQTLETLAMVLGFPLLTSYFWRRRRWRFALAVGAVMLASVFSASFKRQTLHAERNFFGVVRVTGDSSGDLHWLYNGSTIHGRQFTALGRQCEPISYYHRLGPLGRVFEAYQARPASPAVAVVGLGTGATVAYSRPGEHWTFYEINPVVLEVARDPRYFTYLSNCANAPADVVLGDARLRLRDAPHKGYGLIVLDAFSSDAIPVHLMTQEALDLYLSKLADGGLLALHISNRSLDLHPIVADLARSRQLICLVFADNAPNQPDGKEPSLWTVLARRAADVEALTQDAHWRPLEGQPGRQVWTDDFSNIVGVLKW
ncbi:MAG: fused MFS/spermidine synthase [Pyrinomonadaceae bacterium]|nr:fused MFS/spermidine synthase [Pyrinomonadaceae bacterium]